MGVKTRAIQHLHATNRKSGPSLDLALRVDERRQ
jgi:hypothetical protein